MPATSFPSVPDAVVAAGLSAELPAYVYDMQQIRERCREVMAIPIARKSVFFATMANDHPSVLDCIRTQGVGVFVNSMRHLRLACQLGFPPRRIVYAATNMTATEMESCQRLGVRLILDSLGQLGTFVGIARPGQAVGLRLSVGSALDGRELKDDPLYRFGLLPDEIPEAVGIAARHGVKIDGAHSYFGTDLSSAEMLAEAMDRLGRAADALPHLQYLDVGGGFGVKSHAGPVFDFTRYGELAASVMRNHERRRGRPLDLVLEPGRYLTASCGYFFVKVIDVKRRSDRVFAGTNGSVAIFPRPLVYPDRAVHRCEIVGPRGRAPLADVPVYICGNSTYSRDFLARDARLPLPRSGDTLVFHEAGAYCRSMITDFLGKDRPREIIVERPERRVAETDVGDPEPVVPVAPPRPWIDADRMVDAND